MCPLSYWRHSGLSGCCTVSTNTVHSSKINQSNIFISNNNSILHNFSNHNYLVRCQCWKRRQFKCNLMTPPPLPSVFVDLQNPHKVSTLLTNNINIEHNCCKVHFDKSFKNSVITVNGYNHRQHLIFIKLLKICIFSLSKTRNTMIIQEPSMAVR